MKKRVKRMLILMGLITISFLIVIGISFINHKIQLSKENSLVVPMGSMVEVNGHNMHVYTKGQGSETLVFMSGGGTCSPVLDFKSLYTLLEEDYQIVVVEKARYGYSENSNVSRDIDTILGETREALTKAGLHGPYILFPHSMSGIEALFWAQQYPDEVKGIVGLDMAVPQAYDHYSINDFMINVFAFASDIGITRFIPSVVNSSASIKYGTLTKKEKNLYRAIFYRRTLTKPMLKELNQVKANAEKVKESGTPAVPMLFFISNGDGTGWNKEEWTGFQMDYLDTLGSSNYINLDCGHYVHDIEYNRIAEESKQFIKNIVLD